VKNRLRKGQNRLEEISFRTIPAPPSTHVTTQRAWHTNFSNQSCKQPAPDYAECAKRASHTRCIGPLHVWGEAKSDFPGLPPFKVCVIPTDCQRPK